jgi:hypothetical protein
LPVAGLPKKPASDVCTAKGLDCKIDFVAQAMKLAIYPASGTGIFSYVSLVLRLYAAAAFDAPPHRFPLPGLKHRQTILG